MNNFYVYKILDPRKSNQPFYIGKRSGNRIKNTLYDKNNTFKKNVILAIRNSGAEPIVEIVKGNLSENAALILETDLIKQYGRRNEDEDGI